MQRRASTIPATVAEHGFTLVSVLAILFVVSILAAGGLNQGFFAEKIAGDAIQRDRAFQAADGATTIAQEMLEAMHNNGTKADSLASNGIFSSGSVDEKWWENATYDGAHTVDDGTMLGVFSQPRYIVEEVGRYLTDGGTGVVSLDIGSAAYGRRSQAGREVVLYRAESQGKGSFNETQSVIESIFAYTY